MTTIDEMHDHHDAARRSDRWALPLAALGGILVLVSNVGGIAVGDDGVGYRATADSLLRV